MKKIFKIIPLMFITINGYSQLLHNSIEDFLIHCDSNKIIFIDSIGKEISSNKTELMYNGINTIYLDQLDDVDFKNIIGAYPGESIPMDTTLKYCVFCREQTIKIVDSIDINNDGVKELFLHRLWYCSSTSALLGPYGEGGQQLSCSKYEVWDVKSGKKIFDIKNLLDNQMAVSTSVVKSSGYVLDVSIDRFGSLILSNLSGNVFGAIPELGTYKYHIETNTYKKE